jgi:hypothetical protein
MLPGVTEQGFYRAVSSFNAFFHSMRNPKANVTEIRQFTSCQEIDIQKKFLPNVDWNNLKIFNSIWEFYDFIGYNYKTRKYKSGEINKVWNGSYFIVPKKHGVK